MACGPPPLGHVGVREVPREGAGTTVMGPDPAVNQPGRVVWYAGWGDRATPSRPCPQLVPEQLLPGSGTAVGPRVQAGPREEPQAAGLQGGQERGAWNNSAAAEAHGGTGTEPPTCPRSAMGTGGRLAHDAGHPWLLQVFAGGICFHLGTCSVVWGAPVPCGGSGNPSLLQPGDNVPTARDRQQSRAGSFSQAHPRLDEAWPAPGGTDPSPAAVR